MSPKKMIGLSFAAAAAKLYEIFWKTEQDPAGWRGLAIASEPISRVLSSTAIYLDAPLPMRSSHLHGTAGQAICPSAVLLRIEFTAPHCLQPASELLPHFSTLTRSLGRYLSVALVRGSPLAGVTRYPCPAEPGLSSRTAFRLVPAAVRLTRPTILHILPRYVKRCGDLFSCNRVKWAV